MNVSSIKFWQSIPLRCPRVMSSLAVVCELGFCALQQMKAEPGNADKRQHMPAPADGEQGWADTWDDAEISRSGRQQHSSGPTNGSNSALFSPRRSLLDEFLESRSPSDASKPGPSHSRSGRHATVWL
jgi:hypothetical protein